MRLCGPQSGAGEAGVSLGQENLGHQGRRAAAYDRVLRRQEVCVGCEDARGDVLIVQSVGFVGGLVDRLG